MTTNESHEVEIKFLVRDPAVLAGKLESAGFRLKTPSTHEFNTVYDTAHADLRRVGDLLRLRSYGERCLLTHKSRGEPGRHKSRVEHETTVASGDAMHAILTALGYRPVFRYEKYRSEWSDGEGEVVIDRTPIGDLAEIEGSPDWIDRIAKVLNVREGDYITESYAELFEFWKQRTGSEAVHMTFEQCGTQRP
jgi:adenylate cyclase class 2